MSTKRDYYEILGLAKSASKSEIKSAYRKMALKFHPDKNKAKDAEEKFKEINEAYQILSDDQKKQTYDQFGHTAFDPSRGGGMGGNPFSGAQGGPFTWSYTSRGDSASSNQDFGFDMNDPFDIFEQFFGGGFGRTARRPRYGVKISFMEAVHGVKKEIEVDGEKRSVKIPAGASDGTRIRFDKFDVTVDVGTHERFKRDGFDVFIIEKITFSLAAFGGQVEVPTLTDKKLKLKIRPGTQSHSLIRLRGEGIQRLQRRGKGDLYIRIVIEVPEKMDQAQKKALRRLEEAGL